MGILYELSQSFEILGPKIQGILEGRRKLFEKLQGRGIDRSLAVVVNTSNA